MIFSKKKKVFCVGMNKTGTTSLKRALHILGFKMGKQRVAELFLEDWGKRDFRKIVKYCKTADAFQDIPFSLDYTYQTLDHAFPKSKFILTVRDSAEEWYESLMRHQTRNIRDNKIPTPAELKEFTYCYKGWRWRYHELIYGADETTLFDKSHYQGVYCEHNSQIISYFKYRPKDLLVLNVSSPSAMKELCDFLNIKYCGQPFPHLNRTK